MASTYYLKNKSLLSAENLINPPVIPKTDKHTKENYKSIKSIQKSNKAFAKSKEEAKASKKPPFKLDQYKHVESLVFASKPKADIGPFKNPPALQDAKTTCPNFGSKPEYLQTHRQNREEERKTKEWHAINTKFAGMRCLPESERQERLTALLEKEKQLLAYQASLPISTSEMSMRRRKGCEEQLKYLEKSIAHHSKSRVYIRL